MSGSSFRLILPNFIVLRPDERYDQRQSATYSSFKELDRHTKFRDNSWPLFSTQLGCRWSRFGPRIRDARWARCARHRRTHSRATRQSERHTSSTLELPNSYPQGPAIWEPEPDDPKAHVRTTRAWSPVVDEGARTRPDSWPSPNVVIVNPDACLKALT